MEVLDLNNCLSKIFNVINDYSNKIDQDDYNFNIFSILNVSSNEVRLHSNFIAELLNLNGSHTFGSEFCKSFLNSIQELHYNQIIEKFNFENYTVEVEKYIGKISDDYSKGGRIDISLCDNYNNRIIIENKLFANDQENQLLRYHNFDNNALLLYLTLNGDEASHWSTGNKIIANTNYFCISYKNVVYNWLIQCIDISKTKPKISNTILQYANIIEEFTQQSYNHKMKEEIIKIFTKEKAFYVSMDDIIDSYNTLNERIHNKFQQQLEFKKPDSLICKTKEGFELKYVIAEDYDGFFYGFFIEKNGNHIPGNDSEVKYIYNILQNINQSFQCNDYYVGWIFSKYFRKFSWIEKKIKFHLISDIEMNKFTDEIISEITNYISDAKFALENACS